MSLLGRGARVALVCARHATCAGRAVSGAKSGREGHPASPSTVRGDEQADGLAKTLRLIDHRNRRTGQRTGSGSGAGARDAQVGTKTETAR